MSRSRVGLIAVVAVVVFGAAFLLFKGGDDGDTQPTVAAGSGQTTAPATATAKTGPCGPDGAADPAYKVATATQPKTESTSMELEVTKDGKPVKGAKVCLTADMVGMSHPPVGGLGSETSPGVYRFPAKFSMRGGWVGTVTVVPESGSSVAVPVSFDVN